MEEVEDFEESFEGFTDLDDDILAQLQKNDPSITKLAINFGDNDLGTFDPYDYNYINWQKEEHFITENTNIKSLLCDVRVTGIQYEHDLEGTKTRENVASFYKAVAKNRSIKRLFLAECPIVDLGMMLEILYPFFEQNRNLECLDIFTSLGRDAEARPRHIKLLIGALLRFNTNSLRRFSFRSVEYGYNMGDELAVGLINAVGAHEHLKSFCFGFSKYNRLCDGCIGQKWPSSMSNLINDSAELKELDLRCIHIDDLGAVTLGIALGKSNKLKKLCLTGVYSAPAGWIALTSFLISPYCSIEVLGMNDTNIDNSGFTTLANYLANNTSLKDLNLSSNITVTPFGWQNFFNLLRYSSNSSIETFDLNSNDIDDGGLSAMVNSLDGIGSSLKTLNLNQNSGITENGWRQELPRVLQYNLSELSLAAHGTSNNNRITEDVKRTLIESLVSNTSMSKLMVGGLLEPRNRDALSDVLCNKTSVKSIYYSNHTFNSVDLDMRILGDLASYLQMNTNENKAEVARQKILEYHFTGGEKNVQEFVDMDLGLMPYALAWIGRDCTGHTLFYRLSMSMPALFDSNAKAKNALKLKRKREILHRKQGMYLAAKVETYLVTIQ